MSPTIKTIIDTWAAAESNFQIERRLTAAITPANTSSPNASLVMTFIIDSKGYFYDEQCTNVIPLHAERTMVIDDLKSAEELDRILTHFTQSTHDSFHNLLSSLNVPIYTLEGKLNRNLDMI